MVQQFVHRLGRGPPDLLAGDEKRHLRGLSRYSQTALDPPGRSHERGYRRAVGPEHFVLSRPPSGEFDANAAWLVPATKALAVVAFSPTESTLMPTRRYAAGLEPMRTGAMARGAAES